MRDIKRYLALAQGKEIFYAPDELYGNKPESYDLPFDYITVLSKGERQVSLLNIRQVAPLRMNLNFSVIIEDKKLYSSGNITISIEDDRIIWNVLDSSGEINEDPVAEGLATLVNEGLARLNYFVNTMHDKKFIQGTRKYSYKVAKKKYETRNITYITNKKYISDVKGFRDIEWTHCFSVCGHWRKVSGIGKNRVGEYCIDGFTWVKPCKKNKHLVEIEKLRVIKP
jgi:hypothetical protein